MPVSEKPAAAPKVEKKKEEPKPKKEAAPAPAADEDDEPKPAPKPKNPLDLLPPSTMVMDDWKRLYSNTKAKDFKEVAIKGERRGSFGCYLVPKGRGVCTGVR